MSKARNGNRKCPNCKHFIAAHAFEAGTDRRPCFAGAKSMTDGTALQMCLCVCVEKKKENMGTIVSAKVEAAGRLLAAEAEYLRARGWVPLSPPTTGSAIRWRTADGVSSASQEEAIQQQKKKDNWPNVRA